MVITLDPIVLQHMDARTRVLYEPVRFAIAEGVTLGVDANVSIKPCFLFDGASIPRCFWSLIGSPFTGKYVPAALLHDALYASEAFERSLCDKIFLAHMEELDVSWWRRKAMYRAVRLFGGCVWKNHTEESLDRVRHQVVVQSNDIT